LPYIYFYILTDTAQRYEIVLRKKNLIQIFYLFSIIIFYIAINQPFKAFGYKNQLPLISNNYLYNIIYQHFKKYFYENFFLPKKHINFAYLIKMIMQIQMKLKLTNGTNMNYKTKDTKFNLIKQ